jgi:hypothetical protein
MTSKVNRERPVGLLRAAGPIVALVGAVGSLGLMLYAGRHQSSGILLLLFAVRVVSPFLAAMLTNIVSGRLPVFTRATLDVTMLVITLGSLVTYGDVAFGHTRAKIGFVFLMVPLTSWLLIAVVVAIAAIVSRRPVS